MEITRRKKSFYELVDDAINEGPQQVTRLGEDAVVILSFAKYQELTKPKEDLVTFFRNSPFYGLDLEF